MKSLKQFSPLLLSASLLMISCNHVKTDYFPNGNVRSAVTLKGEHYYGPARFYYDDGTLQMECHYINDSLEGKLTRFYKTGVKKEEMYFHKNLTDSIYRLWNPQEVLLVECFYMDSLLDGQYKAFYDNGQIKTNGQYRKDKEAGLWLFYDQTGYIFRQENYE